MTSGVCASQCLVWDYDSRGKHDFIGEFYTTFRELQKISSGNKVSGRRGAGAISPPTWWCVHNVLWLKSPCFFVQGDVGLREPQVQTEEEKL